MNVFLDIETIPQQPEHKAKKLIAETIDAWHNGEGKYAGVKDAAIEDAYRKTAFDAAKGEIISIAWAVEDEDVEGLVCHSDKGDDEEDLLVVFYAQLKDQLRDRLPYFIGHYISKFDLKFIWQRSVILGVQPPFKLHPHGRHGSDFYDTMYAWAGYGGSISQDNLCKALHLPGKEGMDGSKVWDYIKEGRYAEVAEYNKSDVETVRAMYNKINFISS